MRASIYMFTKYSSKLNRMCIHVYDVSAVLCVGMCVYDDVGMAHMYYCVLFASVRVLSECCFANGYVWIFNIFI